jgi:predicted ferric reductase
MAYQTGQPAASVSNERTRFERTPPPVKHTSGNGDHGPARVRIFCTVAFWASLALVTVVWVSNDSAAQMISKSPQGLFAYPGRLAGLLSSDLMLAQVFLMARIPAIERAYGRDKIVRIHRVVGFTSLNLMLVHIALLALGYSLRDDITLFESVVWMVTEWRGMALATAGTLLLILVGFTSARAARRRLRYHTWHLLHLYTFLGMGLVIPHEIWTGSDLRPLWMQICLVGLYLSALASLMIFRVVLPISRNRRHRLVVDRVVEESEGNYSVYLRGNDLQRLQARAGQFCMWRFKDGPGWTRENPYALSAAPNGDTLRITAKEVGPNSMRIRALLPGTPVLFEGPYGRFTGEARQGRKLTLMASGIGITPVRALLEDLDYEPGQAVLIYRAASEKDFVFRQELDELARRRGVRTVYLPGHRRRTKASWQSENTASDDHVALLELVPDLVEHDVFVCGPDSWAEAAGSAALRAGVPARNINIERFAF